MSGGGGGGGAEAGMPTMRTGFAMQTVANKPVVALEFSTFAEFMRTCYESAKLYAEHDAREARLYSALGTGGAGDNNDEHDGEPSVDDLRRAMRRETLDPNGALARVKPLLDHITSGRCGDAVPRMQDVPGLDDERTVQRIFQHFATMMRLLTSNELEMVTEVLIGCLTTGDVAQAVYEDIVRSRAEAASTSESVGASGSTDVSPSSGSGSGADAYHSDDDDEDYVQGDDDNADAMDVGDDDTAPDTTEGDTTDADDSISAFCEPSACPCAHCRSMIAVVDQWDAWEPADGIETHLRWFVDQFEQNLLDVALAIMDEDEYDEEDGGDDDDGDDVQEEGGGE